MSDDPDLLKELARASSSESKAKLEHQKSLLAAKEQERRRLEQKLNNLYESIAETENKVTRKGLSDKAAEVQGQLDDSEASLLVLKAEYESRRNVVDVATAYEYLKIFKNGAFDSQPLAVQAEILKLRVRRIVVQDDGVTVEIYGRKPEVILLGSERSQKTKNPTGLGSPGSSVRTDSKLVGAAGFEPTTPCTPCKCASQAAPRPDTKGVCKLSRMMGKVKHRVL